ncbi:MAG: metallophosphoesterase [Planctomycetes bacterium]|nr:metallophosphoesterase [Planctomycetota bacterium]
MTPLHRRSFLAAATSLLASPLAFASGSPKILLPLQGTPTSTPAQPAARRRVLRCAHLTDIHVQPERGADAGLTQCLKHIAQQQPAPDLMLVGGDTVMDVFEAKASRAAELRRLFSDTWSANCAIPVRHAIGNHDIFGWHRSKSGTTGQEPDWGKKYATELFALPGRYYSFDQAGWHFVILDGVQPKGDSYCAYIDDEQLDWLKKDLSNRPKGSPVLVLSHIPILSLTAITYGKPRALEKRGQDTSINAASMHTDGDTLHELFSKEGVKLCLSGHQHTFARPLLDRWRRLHLRWRRQWRMVEGDPSRSARGLRLDRSVR